MSVATPRSPRSEELGPAGGWGPDRLASGGDAPRGSIAESCPLCGAALGAEQEWCLRCGAAARTRLAATPSWRAPVIALGTVIVLSLGALTAALVSLAGDPGGSTSTVAVTRTVTAPAVAAPPTTAIETASTPGGTVPGASTTAPSTTAPGTIAPRGGATTAGKATTPTTTAPLGTSTHTGTTGTGATTNSSTGSSPATGSGSAKSTKTKGSSVLERDLRAYQRHQGKATGTPAG